MMTNEIRLYGVIGIIFVLDKELQEVEFSQATIFVDDDSDLREVTIEDYNFLLGAYSSKQRGKIYIRINPGLYYSGRVFS